MARMRWMHDEAKGTAVAVCLYCDREVAADPERSFHCYCRSEGAAAGVVGHELQPEARRVA